MTLRRCFSTGLRFVGYFPAHSLAHCPTIAAFTSEMLLCNNERRSRPNWTLTIVLAQFFLFMLHLREFFIEKLLV